MHTKAYLHIFKKENIICAEVTVAEEIVSEEAGTAWTAAGETRRRSAGPGPERRTGAVSHCLGGREGGGPAALLALYQCRGQEALQRAEHIRPTTQCNKSEGWAVGRAVQT